jgi:hypothetical protein
LRYLVSAILALVLMSAIPSAQAQECQLSSYYEHPVTLPKWGAAEEAAPAIEAMQKQLRGAVGLNPSQQVADPGKAKVAVHVVADLRWGRIGDKRPVPAESLLETVIRISGEGVRQLRSPWLWMTETSDCRLTIVLIWNMRQLLVDHAWADGVESGQRGIATTERDIPDEDYYFRFLDEEHKFLAYRSGARRGVKPCIYDEPPTFCPEAQKFPPELLWFLVHLRNTSDTDPKGYPATLGRVMQTMISSSPKTQGIIVAALAQYFLAGSQDDVTIEDIRGAKTIADVNEYKRINEKLWHVWSK